MLSQKKVKEFEDPSILGSKKGDCESDGGRICPPHTHSHPSPPLPRLWQRLCREEQYRREAFSFFLWKVCSVNLLTEMENIFNEISVAHQGS